MIRFHVLGSSEVRGPGGGELRAVVAQPKRLALLAYLVLSSPRGPQRRDTLLGLFWPDLDERRARGALSQALYFLRRSLGRGVLKGRGREELRVDRARIWCDALAFEERLRGGDIAEALDLYRGDLLPGFFLADAPEFERWLEGERARLRTAAAAGAWSLAEEESVVGNADAAARWSVRAVALSPADDGRLRGVLSRLHEYGDRSGALRVYERVAERLAIDLDAVPSEEARAFADRLAAMPPAPEPAARAGSAAAAGAERPSSPPERMTAPAEPPEDVGVQPIPTAPRGRGDRLRWRFAAGLALALVVALGWAAVRPDARSARPGPEGAGPVGGRTVTRLAVLPLRDPGASPGEAYLADGLTDELVTRFARIEGIRVVPPSAMRFPGAPADPAAAAAQLGIPTVLTGLYLREESRPRLRLALLDAASGEPIWDREFELPAGDLRGLQREVVAAVADALGLPAGAEGPSQTGAVEADVYTAYLKGRYHLSVPEVSSIREAQRQFELALRLDPTFAPAWSGQAEAFLWLTRFAVLPAREATPRAMESARQALALDPGLAEAHAALAIGLSLYAWDNQGAEEHFRRALELDPSSARARYEYAVHLRNLGRFDDALAQIRLSQELNPLFPFARIEEGLVLYMARRYDEAVAAYDLLLRVSGGVPIVHTFRALALAQRGDYEDALASLAAIDPELANPDAVGIRGYVEARAGDGAAARRMLARLDELSPERAVTPFQKAAIHVGLGEPEKALDLLERAIEDRSWHLRLLGVEPTFDPLRQEPRFRTLLDTLRLPG